MTQENVVYEDVGGPSGEFGETEYVKYADVQPGTVFEGTYNGSHMGNFEKLTYFILKSDGITLGLNETGKLKYLINKAELSVGQPIKLTYLGKTVVESGTNAGKPAHDFKLAVGKQA